MTQPSVLLAGIPDGLRTPLLHSYQEIASNYMEHRWEPSELNGGKFCEVVYSIVVGYLKGAFPAKPHKPTNFPKACQDIESSIPPDLNRVGDRSLRILVPRMLPALYDIRNNRGVGHVGGDVDPNFMDATAVQAMASWVLAELIRIFHNFSTEEAQNAVNTLVERKHPLIWEIGDVKRVLNSALGSKEQTLALLYGESGGAQDNDLAVWVEYSGLNMYQRRVLAPLHKARLIEYSKSNGRVHLSPKGVQEVEKNILRSRP